MGNGWVKIHRKLIEKGFYKKSQYVHLWLHLLLSANHKPVEYMTNGHTILIKEGQLLTGREQLSASTGIPETTIERILKMLENEHQIGQQKTTKYRLITILHWKEYQERTEERTTNGQQTDTNKNDKNEKKNTCVTVAPQYGTSKEEEAPKKDELRTKDKLAIYRIFSKTEQPWWNFAQEKKAALSLFDLKGVAQVQAGKSFMDDHSDDEYCPQASTPYEYAKKLPALLRYKKKLDVWV